MAGSVDEPTLEEGLENLGEEDRRRAERLHGFLRSYFRRRSSEYDEFRTAMNQARIPETHYNYLAKAHFLAVVAAVVGALFGAAVSALLLVTGGFPTLFSSSALAPSHLSCLTYRRSASFSPPASCSAV